MLSRTATVAPASTSSPGCTGIDDHDGRRRGADDPGLVADDPVGEAVHLDEVAAGAGDGADLVASATDDQAALELVEPVEVDVAAWPSTSTR